MILTCPACTTRYQVDEAKFPAAGRTVRCAKCGNSWHQPGPVPEAAPEPEPEAAVTQVAAAPAADEAFAPAAASGTRAFAPPAQAPPDKPRGEVLQMAAVAAGWIGLVAVVLLIGWSAVKYRQDIATIWPQSAGVYTGLGLKVSANGIDFAKVAYKYEREDGQTVLVVTGNIVNSSSRELPVPRLLRVTLADAGNRELYHWTFPPEAQTLKAGGVLAFRTRLSSPPAAAHSATVSFAKDGP